MQAQKISRWEQEPFGPSSPFPAKGGSLAASGSTLSDLVFAEHARVLELFSRDYLRLNCDDTLACLRGLADPCWNDPAPRRTPRPRGAVNADGDAIERALDELERV